MLNLISILNHNCPLKQSGLVRMTSLFKTVFTVAVLKPKIGPDETGHAGKHTQKT